MLDWHSGQICYPLKIKILLLLQIAGAFFATCTKMEILIADENPEGPQTVIIFLGLELESILTEVQIPKEKK